VYAIGVAPSAERDIERIHHELEARARSGKVSVEFPDQWFEDVMEGIHRLDQFAKRHPYAPEPDIWGRDVRNIILSNGYRILYQMREDTAWVLRVRHQRQNQLKAAGPGSAYRPELVIR
jgi:plasmid stabilization system protein ParE